MINSWKSAGGFEGSTEALAAAELDVDLWESLRLSFVSAGGKSCREGFGAI